MEDNFGKTYEMRENRGSRINTMDEEENKKDQAYWEAIIQEKYGAEVDSQAEDSEDRDDSFCDEGSPGELSSQIVSDCEFLEDEQQQEIEQAEGLGELGLRDRNLRNFPFYRAIMNFVEIDKLERVQYSYVKLPEGYNMGLFTKMIPGSIPAAEINSTLIGVPPPNSAQAPANTSNPSKQILMESEDNLYHVDHNLYIAKMCYTYLQKWKETKSEKYIEKFKKHSITIDKGFANSDVSSEVSVLEIKLAAIISEREKKKRLEVEDHIQYSRTYFKKSLNQKLHNKIIEDQYVYGSDMINFFPISRQLEYEEILAKKSENEIITLGREFIKPVNFVQFEEEANQLNSIKAPDAQKLWPLFKVGMGNRRVLQGALSICFELIDEQCNTEIRENVYIMMQRVFGMTLSISKEDFISFKHQSGVFTDEKASHSLYFLLSNKTTFENALKDTRLISKQSLPDSDPDDYPIIGACDEIMKNLSQGKPYQDLLEYNCVQPNTGTFSITRLTKTILLFIHLYQRLDLYWQIFDKCARKGPDDFDILAVFSSLLQVIVNAVKSPTQNPDIDLDSTFFSLFGEFGAIASNFGHLLLKLTQQLVFTSFDSKVTELVELQSSGVPSNRIIEWMFEKYGSEGRVFFQLISYSSSSKELIFHNIPLIESENIETCENKPECENGEHAEIKADITKEKENEDAS